MTGEAGVIIAIIIALITILLLIILLMSRDPMNKRQQKLDEADEDKALQLPDKNTDMNKNEQLPNENTDINKNKHLLGLIGLAILFVGIFAPIFAVPIVGNINSFSLTIMEDGGLKFGTIILLLTVISFVLTLLKKYAALLFTGITSLFIVLCSFIRLIQVFNKLEDNMSMVNFQWGWPLLVIGAVLLIYSATIKSKH